MAGKCRRGGDIGSSQIADFGGQVASGREVSRKVRVNSVTDVSMCTGGGGLRGGAVAVSGTGRHACFFCGAVSVCSVALVNSFGEKPMVDWWLTGVGDCSARRSSRALEAGCPRKLTAGV